MGVAVAGRYLHDTEPVALKAHFVGIEMESMSRSSVNDWPSLIVPGSQQVKRAAEAEGLDRGPYRGESGPRFQRNPASNAFDFSALMALLPTS